MITTTLTLLVILAAALSVSIFVVGMSLVVGMAVGELADMIREWIR